MRRRDPFFQHSLMGVAWRLALAPQPSLWLSAGLFTVLQTPLEQWPAFIVDIVTKCLIFGLFVAVFTIAVGLPLYLLYRRLGWRWPVAYALGAAAVAVAVYVLPEFLPRNGTFGYSTRDCEVFVRGVRTACGWDEFRAGVWMNVVYGGLAGTVLWALLLTGGRRRVAEPQVTGRRISPASVETDHHV
jgi:hypothetical protein